MSEGGAVGEINRAGPSLLKSLASRPELRRILTNTSWLAGDRLIRLGVGLFLTIWVARYLGPDRFGTLNYALAFVFLFSVLGALGLDSVVIREFIQKPDEKDRLLCTTFILKLTGGVVSFGLSLAVSHWLGTDSTTTLLIAIIGLGTIIQATDAIDFWFQSQVKSKWTVLSKNSAFFLSAIVKVAMLASHAGIVWFAVTAVLEIAIGAAGMVFYLFRLGEAPAVWRPDFKLARKLLAQSWPLFLSGLSVMVYLRIDQVMLEHMAGPRAVGVYSAATRISEMFYFLPTVVASSILPSIVRSRVLGKEIYLARIQKYFDLNAVSALAIALPISLASGLLTHVMYGSQYSGVAAILTVHVWASLFVFMGIARGQYLISEGHFVFTMIATGSGAICNILLNLLWIPHYGALGSAFATLVSYGISDLLSSFCYKETIKIGVMQLKAYVFPLGIRRLLQNSTL